MEKQDLDQLVQLLLDFGEEMLVSGGEIARVEDSLSRLSLSYGACKTDVFVITSSIVLTLKFEDGTVITGSRRIRKNGDFNFERVDAFNALARRCTASPLSLAALREEIASACQKKPKKIRLYAGSALVAGAFSVFFGGSPWDGAFSALFGLLVCFLQLHFSPKCPNKAFFLFVSSLLCGSSICLLGKLFPFLHTDMISIGDIMLLVPGIAITGAVRDMVIGDTISGEAKLVECLLWAGALAAGFMLAILFLGR